MDTKTLARNLIKAQIETLGLTRCNDYDSTSRYILSLLLQEGFDKDSFQNDLRNILGSGRGETKLIDWLVRAVSLTDGSSQEEMTHASALNESMEQSRDESLQRRQERKSERHATNARATIVDVHSQKPTPRDVSAASPRLKAVGARFCQAVQETQPKLDPTLHQAKAGDITKFGKIKSSGRQMSYVPTSVFNRGLKPDPTLHRAKAGDLTHFGKVTKSNVSQMSFAPTSVFNRGPNRDGAPLARTSSSTNMFSALEAANEALASAPTSRQSRPPSRLASVDLTQSQAAEATPSSSRPRLNLLPRSKPIVAESKPEDQSESSEPVSEDEKEQELSMTEEEAKKKIGNDVKEFFAIRNLDEAEDYFRKLPTTYRHLLVDKLVTYTIESKETDAKLVGDLFERANEKELCSVSSFEEGFLPIAELLDDIAIDAPKAFDLMAIMMKGAKLRDESKSKIASKSMDSDELLALLA